MLTTEARRWVDVGMAWQDNAGSRSKFPSVQILFMVFVYWFKSVGALGFRGFVVLGFCRQERLGLSKILWVSKPGLLKVLWELDCCCLLAKFWLSWRLLGAPFLRPFGKIWFFVEEHFGSLILFRLLATSGFLVGFSHRPVGVSARQFKTFIDKTRVGGRVPGRS